MQRTNSIQRFVLLTGVFAVLSFLVVSSNFFPNSGSNNSDFFSGVSKVHRQELQKHIWLLQWDNETTETAESDSEEYPNKLSFDSTAVKLYQNFLERGVANHFLSSKNGLKSCIYHKTKHFNPPFSILFCVFRL